MDEQNFQNFPLVRYTIVKRLTFFNDGPTSLSEKVKRTPFYTFSNLNSSFFGRGTLHLFADRLPDELRDGREPLLLVGVEVLRDPFNQGDRQRHLPVPAFLQDHDDPLPLYHGWGQFLYRLTPNYCPEAFMRKLHDKECF